MSCYFTAFLCVKAILLINLNFYPPPCFYFVIYYCIDMRILRLLQCVLNFLFVVGKG